MQQQLQAASMGPRLVLGVILSCLPVILSQELSSVTVVVRGSDAVAETIDQFVCATIDWWPPEKCNYDQCPWGQSGALNLDLSNPILATAIQAFNPLRIRLGGSLQDQLVYGVPSLGRPCEPFRKVPGGLFGFSEGCLSMERWDDLNSLFAKTGAVVTFGLNALDGRHRSHQTIWVGEWNSTNARDFITYTVSKNYNVDSWEFGNELSGHGVGASVPVELYAKDLVKFRSVVTGIYRNTTERPMLLAPGGFYERQWYSQLLEKTGSGVLDGVTHHIYNLGPGNDPSVESKILDPNYLSRITDTMREIQLTVQEHGPWASPWVGEAGGAYNSGSPRVSGSFLDSFWYLDQLGMASRYNTKVYCRQTLIGANYGLLDSETFVPNPDYYGALLWHRLMGTKVLSLDINGSPYLRAYAHCSKQTAGISVLLINLHKTTGFTVTIQNDLNVQIAYDQGNRTDDSLLRAIKRMVAWVGRRASELPESREEYHLAGEGGNYLSKTVLLNGAPLALTESGDIPSLSPVLVPASSPVHIAPVSIAFVVLPKFEAQACGRR